MRRRASGLIIPSSAADATEPPAFICTLCRAEFKKDQGGLYERHVVRCSAEREEEIRAMSPRTKAPAVFGREGWDVEFEDWVKEHRDQLARGSKRM